MSEEFELDRATALRALGNGCYRGSVSRDFWVQSGPNGGYLAAAALRGASAEVSDQTRAPRTLHVRFLSSPKPAPYELEAEVLKAGRSMTTVAVRMRQDGATFLHASACFSTAFSNVAFDDSVMPEALPLEQAEPLPKRIALNHRYDAHRALGGAERTSPRAYSGGYIRFADGRPIDSLGLAALWDAWPPAVFARAMPQRFAGAVPTVEASIYFRRALPTPQGPTDDYALIRVESMLAVDGIVEESAEIWSARGLLLAQSRQLALLL